MNVLAETLKDMEADAQKLYQLIWRQFVACQMTPAQYDSTTLTVAAGDFKLKARGRTLRFDGWTKVMPALRKGDEDRTLPLVKQGDRLSLGGADACAALYQAAGAFQRGLAGERAGKTRDWPSVDLRVDYFDHSGSRLRAGGKSSFLRRKMGEIVTDRLEENFRDLMNYDFTAQMEDRLDQLRTTEAEWKEVLNHFFGDFTTQLATAEKDPEEGGMQPNPMVLTSIDCPTCGRKMGIRTASTGVFLGCSGYALPPKERCKTTINLGCRRTKSSTCWKAMTRKPTRCAPNVAARSVGRRWTATLSILSVSCTSVVITRPATATRLKRANSASRAMTARWWSARSAVLKCT